ncbi:MAG TPA: hypothetical protein VF170_10605 [Planctomycetaceae bacterium]
MAVNSAKKNGLEWAVFAVGLVLTLGTVGALVYELVSQGERTPPAIEVRLGVAEPRAGHWVVPVTIENTGDETAEGVHVEVTLAPPGGEKEEAADFEVQFLPGRGAREGWVTFTSDPAAGTLAARALGYEKP